MTSEMSSLFALAFKVVFLSGLLWSIHLCLGNANPRWRVWTWRLGSVGLVAIAITAFCSPLLTLRLPFAITELATPTPTTVAVPKIARPFEKSVTSNSESEFSAGIPANEIPHRVISINKETETIPPPAVRVRMSARTVLATVWLTGVLLLATKWILGHRRLAAILGRTEQVPDWVKKISDELAVQFGLIPVSVVATNEIASPSVTGLWRTTILLPQAMLDRYNVDDLKAALTHELVHVRGRDLVWDAWIHMTTILLWPNPFCWRMTAAHREACERLCDGISSHHVGGEAYQSSLARIALQVSPSAQTAGMAMAKTPDVLKRLRYLQKSVAIGSLGLRGVVWAVTLAIASGLVGISGVDSSPIGVADAMPISPQISSTPESQRVKAPIEIEPKPTSDAAALRVASKLSENQRQEAEQPPQEKLERQAVVTYDDKTLYALMPSKPDYKALRKLWEPRTWHLANGKQLHGRIGRVGRLYVSINVREEEIDVKKRDLSEQDQRVARKFQELWKQHTEWSKLRDEKARDAILAEQLPRFRAMFGSQKQPMVIPCNWTIQKEQFGFNDGTILVECDFEFDQLAEGKYAFDVHITSKRKRESEIRPSIGWRVQNQIMFEVDSDLQLGSTSKSTGDMVYRAEIRGNTIHVEAEIVVRESPYSCLVTRNEDVNLHTQRNRIRKRPLPIPKNATAMTFEQFLGEQ